MAFMYVSKRFFRDSSLSSLRPDPAAPRAKQLQLNVQWKKLGQLSQWNNRRLTCYWRTWTLLELENYVYQFFELSWQTLLLTRFVIFLNLSMSAQCSTEDKFLRVMTYDYDLTTSNFLSSTYKCFLTVNMDGMFIK